METAVEWIEQKLIEVYNFKVGECYEIEQAKEMEKKQIIDAYIRGNYKSNRDMYWKIESAEKHYTETFNKDE